MHLGEVEPLFAPEEVLAHIGDRPLDVGLARRIPGSGRIQHEAPVASILLEGALEDGIVAIGPAHGRLEVVQNEANRHAPKELPGVLQSVEELGQLLAGCDVDVLVAAVGQRDDQGVGRTVALGLGIPHRTQAAEVDFGQLARGRLGDPYGQPLPAEGAALDSEPVQGAVGDNHALPGQQPLHLGQGQTASALLSPEPVPNLVGVGQQPPFNLTGGRTPGAGAHSLQDPAGQGLIGFLLRPPPHRLGHREVSPHRLAAAAGSGCDGAQTLPLVTPPENLQHFPHTVLLIDHLASSFGMRSWSGTASGGGS